MVFTGAPLLAAQDTRIRELVAYPGEGRALTIHHISAARRAGLWRVTAPPAAPAFGNDGRGRRTSRARPFPR